MEKNCSRATWALLRRKGHGWNVPLSTFDFTTADGKVLPITYIKPSDLVTFLMTHHPSVLVGGVQSETERAVHLESFWEAFRLTNGDHKVYVEHPNSLSSCLPMAWHGDEGRGKRRGNTVVVSCEAVFSVMTSLNKKRKHGCCDPPATSRARFPHVLPRLSARHKAALDMQLTTMKGHSLLHHFPLFIVPSGIHHEHPEATMELLGIIAADFRKLFYEGVDIPTSNGRKNFTVAIVGAKGDLKWYRKIALERSWENQGVVRNQACCHQCGAGVDGMPFEDVATQNPVWSSTRFSSRPRTTPPVMDAVPYCTTAPEKQYRNDPFHLCKVGIYRDLVGSALCYLAYKGYYGEQGDFPTKLTNAHGAFRLYCVTFGKTAALRTFSRLLLMYPRYSAYPWANVKGSDCMILVGFLVVQCTGFERDPLDAAHLPMLRTIRLTCEAARKVFYTLNSHNLWLQNLCAMSLHAEISRFIKGYVKLASECLNDPFNGFGIKPKLHLVKHEELEMGDALQNGHEIILSWNLWNCESNEDLIGRVCRLSRRLDSRRIGERVLGSCLLKSALLHRRFLETGRLWLGRWLMQLAALGEKKKPWKRVVDTLHNHQGGERVANNNCNWSVLF